MQKPRKTRCGFSCGLAAYAGAALMTIVGCASGAVGQTVLHVNINAGAGGNGMSWKTAYNDLQLAIAHAEGDASVEQIWVAAGTYTPAPPNGDRNLSFSLISGVTIYGHFAGFESSIHDRDFSNPANETILSGDLNSDDGPDFANYGENSFHVVRAIDVDSTARLDGFTIRGGNASPGGPGNPNARAGGLWIVNSSPGIIRCTLRQNFAANRGGGVLSEGTSHPVFLNCSFEANSGNTIGNAIKTDSGLISIWQCVINAKGIGGSTVELVGGGNVRNCVFVNQTSQGGALHVQGGIYTVRNSIFWQNNTSVSTGNQTTLTVSYSCIQGGWPGVGNINHNPLFVNPAAGDVRLQPGSPCIDAGDNTALPPDIFDLDGDGDTDEPLPLDLDGRLRVFDDQTTPDTGNGGAPTVDMGAYEFLGFSNPGSYAIWINHFGGDYEIAGNWSPVPPDSNSDLLFSLHQPYTVWLHANQSARRMIVRHDEVSIDLGGRTLALNAAQNAALVVGEQTDDDASLLLAAGTVNAPIVQVGAEAGATGRLTLGAGATLTAQETICVGCAGYGELELLDGAQLVSLIAYMGKEPGASGIARLTGPMTTWSVPFFLLVDRGEVHLNDGAKVASGFGAFLSRAGAIRGDGVVHGELVNFGLVKPAGILSVTGDYEQVGQIFGFGPASGSLRVELGGEQSGIEHDMLTVGGIAKLGGGLFVELQPEYLPSLDSSFTVLNSSLRLGTFDVAFMPGLPDGLYMYVSYDSGVAGGGNGAVTVHVDLLENLLGFGGPTPVAGGDGTATAVAVGDFDGVNGLDIAVTLRGETANDNGSVLILFNNGDGTLFTPVQITIGREPSAIAVGDFTGNGRPDIAATNREDNTVSVLLNDGFGGFALPPPIGVGTAPSGIVAADLRGIGTIDLAVTNAGSNTVHVLHNLGGGIFNFVQSVNVGQQPSAIAAANLLGGVVAGPSSLDLAVTNFADDTVTILENVAGGGTFVPVNVVVVGNGPTSIKTVDIEDNKDIDILVANQTSATVSVLVSTGGGTYAPAVDLPLNGTPTSMAMWDMDGDGDNDVAIVVNDPELGAVVRIWRNDSEDGQIVFAPAESVGQGENPVLVTSGDVTGNGEEDLITVNATGTAAATAGDGSRGNRGAGTGGKAFATLFIRPNLSEGTPTTPGDLNNDGSVDVLDLLILLGAWGPCPKAGPCPADLNNSGTVDVQDLLILLSNWG